MDRLQDRARALEGQCEELESALADARCVCRQLVDESPPLSLSVCEGLTLSGVCLVASVWSSS